MCSILESENTFDITHYTMAESGATKISDAILELGDGIVIRAYVCHIDVCRMDKTRLTMTSDFSAPKMRLRSHDMLVT